MSDIFPYLENHFCKYELFCKNEIMQAVPTKLCIMS